MATVYTGGTFDLLHPGHIHLLAQCRHLAGPRGRVVVSVNTDEFVMRYKRRPPVMDFEDRCTMLRALRDVDQVVTNFGNEDSKVVVDLYRPNIVAIGEDWAPWNGKDYYSQMGFTEAWLQQRHIQVLYLPLLEGRSSTNLRNRANDPGPDRSGL